VTCMTCREIVEFLMAYLDGELPADQEATFKEHISACPQCLSYLDTYTESIKLGKVLCREGTDERPEGMPEDLVKAILAARKDGGQG
jgi:anti-sigma factor (TIGR02949 family)